VNYIQNKNINLIIPRIQNNCVILSYINISKQKYETYVKKKSSQIKQQIDCKKANENNKRYVKTIATSIRINYNNNTGIRW
jgi:hypothetical protein